MTKTLTGTVISAKMNKSVVVMIERKFRHPFYQKVIKKHKKIKANNEDLKLIEGDVVRIRETRPISKEIRFVVVEKVSTK